jgi:GT2 family glycosyltransferase
MGIRKTHSSQEALADRIIGSSRITVYFREIATVKVEVTVSIPLLHADRYIHACLKSLLAQTFRDFEIITVEDPPYDGTKQIIDEFKDDRIRYLRNREFLGVPKSQNKSLRLAEGKYIFFTDADCIVSENWIEQGLKSFRNENCVAVEGKTHYVSKNYTPTFSDHPIRNEEAGQFMTCNMAYKRSVLENIGGFDERFDYLEDRDLGLRVLRLGQICFNPEMVVHHRKVTTSPIQFVKKAKWTRNRVLLYKKFKEKQYILWRIMFPTYLMATIFPPFIIVSLFRNQYRTKEDLALFPFIYPKLVYERLSIWQTCAKERVFLI